MSTKRKSKKVAASPILQLRPPTPQEAEAITHAYERIANRRRRVQVTLDTDANAVCQLGQTHSDGTGWSTQMTDAFGTTSEDFAHTVFISAMNALGATERTQQTVMNGVLAAIDGAQPKDEIEAMLVSQMAVTHHAAMTYLARATQAQHVPQLEASGNLAVKLLRTFTAQAEALAKLQRGGEQTVRVEHVHVHSGGQAIVGSIAPAGGGGKRKSEDQPYALPRPNTPRDVVPIPGHEKRPVPDPRRTISGRTEGK
jgi:hypothetical protein